MGSVSSWESRHSRKEKVGHRTAEGRTAEAGRRTAEEERHMSAFRFQQNWEK